MMGKLTALWSMAVLAIAYPAVAQEQVPRTYPESWPDRPVSSKSAQEQELDDARANADATACNSSTFTACADLGDAYRLGEGRPQNRPVAELLYRKACDGAVGKGCVGLGILLRGTTQPNDRTIAESYFERACQLGVRDSCDSRGPERSTGRVAGPEFNPELNLEAAALEQNLLSGRPEQGRDRGRSCTTVTVSYQGQSYSDTVCQDLSAPFIIGGFELPRGKAPWQALLWRPPVMQNTRLAFEQRVLCGGTVIRTGWVLTAAHCLTDEGGVSVVDGGHRIRLGLNNPLTDEGISYPIINAFRHPDYNRSGLAFDIALIQYDTRLGVRGSSSLTILPIRFDREPLAARPISNGMRAYTYGWGHTQFGSGGEKPDRLRGARLTLLNTTDCTALTRFTDDRRDSVLCANEANTDDGGQACNGDSGGPLITFGDSDGKPTLIGVVSGGFKCGTVGLPSRYTRVAKVMGWISEKMNE